MQFHPFEPVLITASEDATCKMWNLGEKNVAEHVKSSQGATGIADLEPRYTFRGHKGAILAMDMSSTGEMFFTGGHDTTICCWEVPDFNLPLYDHYDRRLLTETLKGHTDCVWSVVYLSSSNRIISGSADGTIRYLLFSMQLE
jgi:striatin 1/3/4